MRQLATITEMSQDPDPSMPPSDTELRKLIKNATGGHRTTDYTGVISFQDGTTLCVGSENDVNWKSEGDQMFVTRVTPYVVKLLLDSSDSAERRCLAYAILLRKHGIDPAGIVDIMREDSFMAAPR